METQDDPVTDLTRNGSYLVYRRLHQDVATFRAEAIRIAGLLSANASFGAKDADFAGACLVGRWASGAPPSEPNSRIFPISEQTPWRATTSSIRAKARRLSIPVGRYA